MGLDACVHVRTTCKELACKRMHAFHATRPSQWGGPAKSAMAAWLHSASPLVQSSRSVIYLLRVAPRISASQPRRGFPADRVKKWTTVCACIRYRIPIASRDTHPFYCGCGRQASEQRHVLLNRCDLHSNQERTSRMNLLTHTHTTFTMHVVLSSMPLPSLYLQLSSTLALPSQPTGTVYPRLSPLSHVTWLSLSTL